MAHRSDDDNDWSDELIRTFAPSLPPTIAAIVGFYVFHKLALRRQRRQEILDDVRRIKTLTGETLDIGRRAWRKSGKAATSSGDVVHLRGKLIELSLALNSLGLREKAFKEASPSLSALRKSLDEELNESGNALHTVDDVHRAEREDNPDQAIIASRNLLSKIDAVFSRKFK